VAKIKRIGLLTGGGDCPGLNAAIRAVTKAAINKFGLEVIGIRDGFLGAVENRFQKLGYDDVSGILCRGGTILGSNNRVNPFCYGENKEDKSGQVIENFRQMGIEALVVVGGDGTLTVSREFHQRGWPLVAIPKTIDNDVHQTEWTIGFNTACTIAGQAIDALHSTAESHHRVMVVEVMGRYTGWIALHSGVASGGDVILIPEIPYDLSRVCKVISDRDKTGRTFSILVAAEGIKADSGEIVVKKQIEGSAEQKRLGGVGNILADQIETQTGKETRVVILGHLQRSGMPTEFDRTLATLFGEKAVSLVAEGKFGKMTAYVCGQVNSVDITEVVKGPHKVPVDSPLITAAKSIGTSFGD
jgi:6-phosphofructokinase 1